MSSPLPAGDPVGQTAETALQAALPGVEQLRLLPASQLAPLAAEIRAFLVEKVCAAGGHLGPNLGVVELTIALHRAFDSPRDAIIFDTGHQTYVHKLLTGRTLGFDRLRQAGGLSGYPCRAESPHDWIENSHSSTALAYADGLAKAHVLAGERDRSVVAVVGDGALTGGMSWEALNHIGAASERPVIVVLNDNGRSYAPTTGALASHLKTLKSPEAAHEMTWRRNMFTDLGFAYLGPVDGHDLTALQSTLRQARALGRPVVVHAVTVKGKGYDPAEGDEADCLHAVTVVDAATGRPAATHRPRPPSWTSIFSQALLELAVERQDMVALTASMLRTTGLHPMAVKFPERVFDVGIAEQHAVTSAAGLAMGGCHPVVALYSTFLARALDQVLMDVALHRLPVTFVLDRAGITGPDGPSHHGMWDLTLLGMVPGMRIAVPRDAAQLRALLREAVQVDDGPTTLRIPKAAAGAHIPALACLDGIDILHRSPAMALDVLLVAAGPLAGPCLEAAAALQQHGIGCTVVDPRWLMPVNPALVQLAARHRLTLTAEDNTRTGGFGTALAQACQDAQVQIPVVNLGLPHAFLPHGPRSDLLATAGLDAPGIADSVRRHLSRLGACPTPSAAPTRRIR